MDEIEKKLISLSKSKFRGSFHLNNKMKEYVNIKGIDVIKQHAVEIIVQRLKPKNPYNDGKQTPFRQVHPVFIAQHATGCCCRGCLEKIHHISQNKELNDLEIKYIVDVIIKWIKMEVKDDAKKN